MEQNGGVGGGGGGGGFMWVAVLSKGVSSMVATVNKGGLVEKASSE